MSALLELRDTLHTPEMGSSKAQIAYERGYQSYQSTVGTSSNPEFRDADGRAHCPFGSSQIGMRCAWMAGWNDADIAFRGRQVFVQRCDDLGIMAA